MGEKNNMAFPTLDKLRELQKCDRFNIGASKILRADNSVRGDAYIETVEGDCSSVIKVTLKELIELAIAGHED